MPASAYETFLLSQMHLCLYIAFTWTPELGKYVNYFPHVYSTFFYKKIVKSNKNFTYRCEMLLL